MRRLREENRDLESAREHSKPGNMVLMLVRNQDGGDLRRVFPHHGQSTQKFTAREARIHQNPRAAGGDDGAVALGTRG